METSHYLGNEKIGRLLIKFCIPCIASLIISCLYNIVDQIFVGNGVGYLGNAATGVIFPITVIGWGMSLFFGDGAAAYLSVALGKNETKTVHRGIGNSILFSFLSGVVIILISYLWGDGLLRLIGATDATIALAHDYGFIIYIMMPLAMTQNTLASIIRADGSPRYAMGAMIAGALINIVGDPVAIFALGMGIKGAAYATILGQFISFLLCAFYLVKSKTFRLQADSFRVDLRLMRQIMALGTSSLLTQLSIVVITVVNNILLVKYGAVSAYGSDIPLAAFVVIMKLFQIVLNIAIGIAAGAQPIVGYNYGAQKFDRVRELLKAVLKWTAIVGIVCMILFEGFPGAFIRLFGSDGELYMEFAVRCLRIYLLLILFTCLQKVCAIFLQSIGRAQAAAPLAVLRDLLLIVFSMVMPVFFGVTGIFWAAPAADIFAMLITAAVMLRLWKELQGEKKEAAVVAEGHIQPSNPGVIVTISREHGSAGKRIGQLLAEMLQVPCYYKEVTALAARESGLAAEFISDINKNSPDRLKELYMSTTIVQQAVIAQDKIIRKIAESGSCVIIGRAADYVLRERPDVVRIFIRAPKEYRVKKIMEMYGDTKQDAEKNLEHSDAARANYYHSVTGLPWAYSNHYELCIDSSVGEQACAEMIYAYLGKKGY
ncbi:MAG: MATE family efflux transporter [Blautia sp.]|nr:MATE family efflux transporter [Blautia sp.]MCM1200143.1 MATE family efflux transporter [Bacteroides fragilis]